MAKGKGKKSQPSTMKDLLFARYSERLTSNRVEAITKLGEAQGLVAMGAQEFAAPFKADVIEFQQYKSKLGVIPQEFQEVLLLDKAMAQVGVDFAAAFAATLKSM